MNRTSLLAPDLHIKPSSLFVRDLAKVGAFYRDVVGLDLLIDTKSRQMLGRGDVPIIELVSRPEYDSAPARSAGLFHNAIVYFSRADLARTVLRVLQRMPEYYEGSADHLVSEAFYFHDPEGNGLELYFDRPREEWEWISGQVKMATLPLDPHQYILNNLSTPDQGAKGALGHVHLRVGDVPSARAFYVDTLGFDVTADMGEALFVSVGGYHHHMAMNTWMSKGADMRDPALGLAEVRLVVPSDGSIDSLANRLEAGKVAYRLQDDGIRVADPWGNNLHVAVG